MFKYHRGSQVLLQGPGLVRGRILKTQALHRLIKQQVTVTL